MKKIYQICALFSVLLCGITFADKIQSYHSDITVLEDGTIDVLETIQLFTNHDVVKLGITRDFPNAYYFMNKRIESPIEVLSVDRNGRAENYWVETYGDYSEIFTGSVDNAVDNYLDKGKHTFKIHWRTKNYIRSFADYDELYINAIGHNWRLPIEKASVTLHLPKTVQALQSSAYYGESGETTVGQITEKSPQNIEFTVPVAIGNQSGLTIATGFTKGIIPSVKPYMIDVWVDKFLGKLPSFVQPINLVLFAMVIVLALYRMIGGTIHRQLLPS